jgi:molecular chaperone GrpE
MEVKKTGSAEPQPFQVIDRRPFANLDSLPLQAPVEEKPRYPTYVEELQARVSDTQRRFEEMKSQMQQDVERTRARLHADFERRVQLEKRNMILPMLDVLDNLERAIAAAGTAKAVDTLRQGIEMTAGLFRSKLRSLGIEPIEVLNRPFDPHEGQATATVPVTSPELDGIVVDEVARGYRMGDQILRPAEVRVGSYRADL